MYIFFGSVFWYSEKHVRVIEGLQIFSFLTTKCCKMSESSLPIGIKLLNLSSPAR
jgi:hypothetical protein